jgi:hypothetical protein
MHWHVYEEHEDTNARYNNAKSPESYGHQPREQFMSMLTSQISSQADGNALQ